MKLAITTKLLADASATAQDKDANAAIDSVIARVAAAYPEAKDNVVCSHLTLPEQLSVLRFTIGQIASEKTAAATAASAASAASNSPTKTDAKGAGTEAADPKLTGLDLSAAYFRNRNTKAK